MGELEALRSLNHINIVHLYDWKLTPIFLYIFIELCSEGSLNAFIRNMGTLLIEMTVSFMKQITSGIRCLHDNNVMHRDVKPDNILVHKEHGDYVIKITDLGFAKRVPDTSAVVSASGAGTLDWMAPDIYPGEDEHVRYSRAADIFSLGLVFLSLIEHVPGNILQARKGM